MRYALIRPLFFLTLPLLIIISGCQTTYPTKQVTVIKQFDKSLSLSRDNKTNQFYLQSKNGEPKGKCGNDWYSDSASFTQNDKQTVTHLNHLVDINTLKIDTVNQNVYTLHDKNYQYFVVLTLCDNHVSYEKL